jgi:hypothetical protein
MSSLSSSLPVVAASASARTTYTTETTTLLGLLSHFVCFMG